VSEVTGELIPLTPRIKPKPFTKEQLTARFEQELEKAQRPAAKVIPPAERAKMLRDQMTAPERTSVAEGLRTDDGRRAYDVMAEEARAEEKRRRAGEAQRLGVRRTGRR
jgi:hypothetical protein